MQHKKIKASHLIIFFYLTLSLSLSLSLWELVSLFCWNKCNTGVKIHLLCVVIVVVTLACGCDVPAVSTSLVLDLDMRTHFCWLWAAHDTACLAGTPCFILPHTKPGRGSTRWCVVRSPVQVLHTVICVFVHSLWSLGCRLCCFLLHFLFGRICLFIICFKLFNLFFSRVKIKWMLNNCLKSCFFKCEL